MSSHIIHPPYGGQGQARAPKFQVDDPVHILSVAHDGKAASQPTSGSTHSKTAPSQPIATSFPTKPIKAIQPHFVSEHIPKSTWKVFDITPSASDQIEHVYHLKPTNALSVFVPESRLLKVHFLPGDIIKKAKVLYEVQELRFLRNAAGEMVVRYLAKDEVNVDAVIDHDDEVQAGDAGEWFPISED